MISLPDWNVKVPVEISPTFTSKAKPPVTSTVSVALLWILTISSALGCPPGPLPVVIALQSVLLIILIWAPLTIWVKVPNMLPLSLLSPLYAAVIVWVPTVKVVPIG